MGFRPERTGVGSFPLHGGDLHHAVDREEDGTIHGPGFPGGRGCGGHVLWVALLTPAWHRWGI